jgi:hypothetical protein
MTPWARVAITSQSEARIRKAMRAGASACSPLRQVADCAGAHRLTGRAH